MRFELCLGFKAGANATFIDFAMIQGSFGFGFGRVDT
jgi:hypothetical protein